MKSQINLISIQLSQLILPEQGEQEVWIYAPP